jgi:hypothetical protein
MAAKKTHDLAVVVREYQNNQGETKKQWLTIGARIEYDDGGASLLIDRHINFAGLPGEGPVRVSMFEPRPRDGQQQAPQQARNYSQTQASAPSSDFDDSIPF